MRLLIIYNAGSCRSKVTTVRNLYRSILVFRRRIQRIPNWSYFLSVNFAFIWKFFKIQIHSEYRSNSKRNKSGFLKWMLEVDCFKQLIGFRMCFEEMWTALLGSTGLNWSYWSQQKLKSEILLDEIVAGSGFARQAIYP